MTRPCGVGSVTRDHNVRIGVPSSSLKSEDLIDRLSRHRRSQERRASSFAGFCSRRRRLSMRLIWRSSIPSGRPLHKILHERLIVLSNSCPPPPSAVAAGATTTTTTDLRDLVLPQTSNADPAASTTTATTPSYHGDLLPRLYETLNERCRPHAARRNLGRNQRGLFIGFRPFPDPMREERIFA
jgi:hypothetical protein